MGAVAEDLIPILTKFHREIVLPDIQRAVADGVGELRREMSVHFDAIYKRFDRLETEYEMIVAGLKRLEERMDRVEQQLSKMALRSELLDLKARVDGLQEQVRTLEARLED
jgi:predicted  nucleic acid-binding Zn-ribbon protein